MKTPTDNFTSLGLSAPLAQTVHELGYEAPTAIQKLAIPPLLAGVDIMGQAQTGTGKTAAFALPMLLRIDTTTSDVQGLILVPTRELANQVSNAIFAYGRNVGARVLAIYGGQSYARQRTLLQKGPQIVVGTPGRTLDWIRQGQLDLSAVNFLVLDEADEMLRMGFIEEVEAILKQLPPHQTALFSATFDPQVRMLADRYMNEPASVSAKEKTLTVENTEQRYYLVDATSKVALLTRLLEIEPIKSALIFTRTKIGAAALAETLATRGLHAEALHGDLSQETRETALRRFRRGQTTLLVATDVAARGLDISDVSHVINFDMAEKPDEYVHRVGRTGRAGQTGVAISLVTPTERYRLPLISNYTRHILKRARVPTISEVQAMRESRQSARLEEALRGDLAAEKRWVEAQLAAGQDLLDIAAAALKLWRGEEVERPLEEVREIFDKRPSRPQQSQDMVALAFELGSKHGIQPRDVVGAITREAGVPAPSIGDIEVGKSRTTVKVAASYVSRVLRKMAVGSMRGQAVRMVRVR